MNTAIDVRNILSSIRVPTLVIRRADDADTEPGEAEYLANRILNARLVVLPGGDHLPWTGDTDSVADEIEEFLTGVRGSKLPERVLATILMTDIVGSTTTAHELGDRRWKELLERHHTIVRERL